MSKKDIRPATRKVYAPTLGDESRVGEYLHKWRKDHVANSWDAQEKGVRDAMKELNIDDKYFESLFTFASGYLGTDFYFTYDEAFGIGGTLGRLVYKTKVGVSKGYQEAKRVGKELKDKGIKQGSKAVAKDYATKAFQATKKAAKESLQGYKDFAKEIGGKKNHDKRKKLAISVLDDTKRKVNDDYKIILTSAQGLVEDKYEEGGSIPAPTKSQKEEIKRIANKFDFDKENLGLTEAEAGFFERIVIKYMDYFKSQYYAENLNTHKTQLFEMVKVVSEKFKKGGMMYEEGGKVQEQTLNVKVSFDKPLRIATWSAQSGDKFKDGGLTKKQETKYGAYFKGEWENETNNGYEDVYVFEFPDEKVMHEFLDEVGGMPHPLGGHRTILSKEKGGMYAEGGLLDKLNKTYSFKELFK